MKHENTNKSIEGKIETSTQFYILIDGEQIFVTEEVYRAYKRPLWREKKEKERRKRCRDENGNRCTKNCNDCLKSRNGSDLSLEKLSDIGLDVADPVDYAEFVADELLLEQLLGVLNDEEIALIDALFYKERTEQDYAVEVGVSQQAIGKRKKKIIDKLRKQAEVHEI